MTQSVQNFGRNDSDAIGRLAAGSGLVFHRGNQLHGMAPGDAAL
jgi:hypothetical protein